MACYLWLEFKDPNFKNALFSEFNFPGIKDDDIEIKERRIMREVDREIESETSK